MDDGEQLSIIDVVVVLSGNKRLERYEYGCQSLLESVWRRIMPEAYLEVSVAMAKGFEKLGR